MSAAVSTTVTELPESRVRVEAEVAPDEVERRVEEAARSLARDMTLPGFRKGKVPPPVVLQRLGREAVLDEAVRDSIGGWYSARSTPRTSFRSASRTSRSRGGRRRPGSR